MADNEFFCSPRDQSLVKTRIVKKYFKSWAGIMKSRPSRDGRIGYLDLFCGPGRFDDGTDSTPVEILNIAIDNEDISDKLVTTFTDKVPEHIEMLNGVIKGLPGINKLKYPPKVSCVEIGKGIAEEIERLHLIPCLIFLDPCGYKGLSLQLISSCTKDWGCDCILFFNTNRIRAAIENPRVGSLIDDLFGEKRALILRADLSKASNDDKEGILINALQEALADKGAIRFVLPFKFVFPDADRTSHHLIFITKNETAYGIMKEIMYKESTEKQGEVALLAYSPKTDRQQFLFEDDLIGALKEDLILTFQGEKLKVDAIYRKHNVGTPYIMKNYKEALKQLETEGKVSINPPADERRPYKGQPSLPDDAIVTFP